LVVALVPLVLALSAAAAARPLFAFAQVSISFVLSPVCAVAAGFGSSAGGYSD
jgi:hypothetical protein